MTYDVKTYAVIKYDVMTKVKSCQKSKVKCYQSKVKSNKDEDVPKMKMRPKMKIPLKRKNST